MRQGKQAGIHTAFDFSLHAFSCMRDEWQSYHRTHSCRILKSFCSDFHILVSLTLFESSVCTYAIHPLVLGFDSCHQLKTCSSIVSASSCVLFWPKVDHSSLHSLEPSSGLLYLSAEHALKPGSHLALRRGAVKFIRPVR